MKPSEALQRLSLLILVTLLAACSNSSTAVPDLNATTRISAGHAIYDQHCAACHGVQLEGQPDWTTRQTNGRLPAPPHDDSGHTWHHDSTLLFNLVKHGVVAPYAPDGYVSDMPAFGGQLSDEEIWSVLAYIRSRWSPAVQQRHDALDAEMQRQRQP